MEVSHSKKWTCPAMGDMDPAFRLANGKPPSSGSCETSDPDLPRSCACTGALVDLKQPRVPFFLLISPPKQKHKTSKTAWARCLYVSDLGCDTWRFLFQVPLSVVAFCLHRIPLSCCFHGFAGDLCFAWPRRHCYLWAIGPLRVPPSPPPPRTSAWQCGEVLVFVYPSFHVASWRLLGNS